MKLKLGLEAFYATEPWNGFGPSSAEYTEVFCSQRGQNGNMWVSEQILN